MIKKDQNRQPLFTQKYSRIMKTSNLDLNLMDIVFKTAMDSV